MGIFHPHDHKNLIVFTRFVPTARQLVAPSVDRVAKLSEGLESGRFGQILTTLYFAKIQ